MLDANILGPLCHQPERHRAINAWFAGVVANPRHHPLLPELADYEVRRGLLHLQSQRGLERLNSLVHTLVDADAILAAQAFGAAATLITDNARHFAHYPVRALRRAEGARLSNQSRNVGSAPQVEMSGSDPTAARRGR